MFIRRCASRHTNSLRAFSRSFYDLLAITANKDYSKNCGQNGQGNSPHSSYTPSRCSLVDTMPHLVLRQDREKESFLHVRRHT